MKTLRDKAIIITGAGGAIAGAVEEALMSAGARPILVDRNRIRIQGRASSYDTPFIEADLTRFAEAQAMVERARVEAGPIDGLIHLIGDVVTGRVLDLDPEAYARVFDTNVRTLYHSVKAVLPALLEREEAFLGGIASREGFLGGAAGSSLFAAAKSAVATFLRSLDLELEGSTVGVSIIFPMGPVDTMTNRRPTHADPDTLIDTASLGEAFVIAATAGRGGRLLEIPIYPPRRPRQTL